ncbi:asparaginase [Salinicola rhizosphaerae]|uniref:L-asparaginase 1 n=1 Tax=Salinicola rhizosphaerae TaxID=1443141 RepID=A0ABQ3DQH8_9GAMM|nr:asparaginase [Salinicola rhizosphaerae]GHB10329.1 L-asparaginase 1 [Salinicola rhizosphaerae]
MEAAGTQGSAPVLILYAGGTIGMRESERGLVPADDFAARLERAMSSIPPARQARLPRYTLWESSAPIDSSSATPADWSRLAEHIAAVHEQYAGFIVLHGTDTLAWCACSLAFQLQGLGKPVIVTGSQKPLEADDSDALGNIETALAFSATPGLSEVCVGFGGRLLRGTRARKWYTHDAIGFESPNWPPLGEMVEHVAVLYPSRCHQDRGAPRFELIPPQARSPIVRVPLWPGMQGEALERLIDDDAVTGVLLECWGSGNLPEDPTIIGVLAQASASGKTLVALSQCPVGGVRLGTYASGAHLVDLGVLAADDMTVEAAGSKLTHLKALSLSTDELRRRFLTPLAGESGAFTR